jgi:uncharacterized protein
LKASSPYGILEGVFRELVSRHVPLGMRDYLDGLRALDCGFGHGDRNDLRLLCQRLWARSDFERRTIDLTFSLIPPPSSADAEVEELDHRIAARPEHCPSEPSKLAASSSARDDGATQQAREATDQVAKAGVVFAREGQGGGIALAEGVPHLPGGETYVLQPQALFSERQLAVMWRRLRMLTRRGIARELDIDGTIREKCRSGVLPGAILRPARRNISDLLIFADVSPSMAPWRPFLQAVSDSLPLGNLRKWQIYYFSNYPREWFFRSPALKERIKFSHISQTYGGSVPLLIFGDAGAARGGFNPRRIAQTAEFFQKADAKFKPMVWINPMPRQRWRGTSAEALAEQPRLSVFPLERDTLVRAVDVLRGERPA